MNELNTGNPCNLTPDEQDKLRSFLTRTIPLHGRRLNQIAHSSITGIEIADGAIIASKLTESVQEWITDIVFSATDADTVAWTSGTIKFSDGTIYSITASNTGNMAALTYIYFDSATSATTLQLTTTFSNITGETKILVCVANKTADATQKAFFIPSVGVLGINETVIGPFSISTGKIQANAITTNEIAANAVTAAKISVASLSAISADLGTITAGTITGNTIRNTSSANSRIQLNTTAFTVTDSSGTEFYKLEPSTIGVKVYTPSFEQHPNIGGSFVMSTRPSTSDSDILTITASGTSSSTKSSSITLTPGVAGVGAGQITFATQNTVRFALGSYGLIPAAANTYDLGSSSNTFKDGYFAGVVKLDTLTPASTNITVSSGSIRVPSTQGIGTSLTAIAFDDSNGLLGYTNVASSATECLRINSATTKIFIGGTYYTLSVVAGVVNAA